MITDKKLDFGEIEIPDASNVDTDVLDFQKAKVAFGGGNLFFNAIVSQAGAGGTSATVKLMHSADGSTWVDIASTPAVLLADLTLGKMLLSISMPSNARQYVKGNVAGAGTFGAGKVKLFFTLEPYQAS